MNEEFYRKLIDYRNSMGLARNLGIRVLEVREGFARAELTVSEAHVNLIGTVHGGILMTFADIVASVAAWSYGIYTTTMNCSVNFLNAASHVDRLRAEARVEKHGRRSVVARVVLTDPEDTVILTGSFTLFSLDKPIVFD